MINIGDFQIVKAIRQGGKQYLGQFLTKIEFMKPHTKAKTYPVFIESSLLPDCRYEVLNATNGQRIAYASEREIHNVLNPVQYKAFSAGEAFEFILTREQVKYLDPYYKANKRITRLSLAVAAASIIIACLLAFVFYQMRAINQRLAAQNQVIYQLTEAVTKGQKFDAQVVASFGLKYNFNIDSIKTSIASRPKKARSKPWVSGAAASMK